MISCKHAVAIPIYGRAEISSLGEAFHIRGGETDIVFIPSLNRVIHCNTPNRVFLTRDYGPVAVDATSSQVQISSIDASESGIRMRFNCLDVAIGKTYVAVLYRNRVSIVDFKSSVISEIPIDTSISREIESRPLRRFSPIYNDKAFLSCLRNLMTRTLIAIDARKGTIIDVLAGNELSYDGRYAVELLYVGLENDVSRVVMKDLNGSVVFNDIVRGKVCSSCVGDYLVLSGGSTCQVIYDIKRLRSIAFFAKSIAVTNDGYIGVVTNNPCPIFNSRIVHIFHVSDIPDVKWGAFRASALCMLSTDVSVANIVKIGSDQQVLAKDNGTVETGLCS